VFELARPARKTAVFFAVSAGNISDEGFRAAGILEWVRGDQLKNREATSELL
jgi:hypothetical protein